jgi:hypothetical protein
LLHRAFGNQKAKEISPKSFQQSSPPVNIVFSLKD